MKTKLKNVLPKMPPGAVCSQMVRCGKSNCKCAGGELHGPYYYHFTRSNGVLVKRYVSASDADRIRDACQQQRVEEKKRREAVSASRRQWTVLLARLREYAEIIGTLKG